MKKSIKGSHLASALAQYGWLFLWASAAALLLLGIALAVIYQAFQGIMLRSVAQQNREFSVQVDAHSNLLQTAVESYSMQIFYNPAVVSLRENSIVTPHDQVYGMRELTTYSNSCEFAESITVYNQSANRIFTTDSMLAGGDPEDFADKSALDIFLNRSAETRIKPILRTVTSDIQGYERECYSFLLFESTPRNPYGNSAIMVNVPTLWYETQLLGLSRGDDYILLDGDGSLLGPRESHLQQSAALFWHDIVAQNSYYDTESYLIRSIGGVRTVCFYSYMSASGWYCMRILPLDDCIPGLLALRNHLSAILTLGVMLLMALCVLVLLFVYFPFRHMSLTLRKLKPETDVPLATAEQLDLLVESSIKQRQESHLSQLLSGSQISQQSESINFPAVLLLIAPSSPEVSTALERICPDCLYGSQNGLCFALLSDTDEPQALAVCDELIATCSCRCYCSVPRNSTDELPACRDRLLELHALRFWRPRQKIISERILEQRSFHSGFSEKSASQLAASLRSGELNRARETWSTLLLNIRNDSLADQRFAFRRIAKLVRELMTECSPTETAKQDTPPLFKNFESLEDIAELTAQFDLLFVKITEVTAGKKKKKLDDTAARVAERIDLGYRSPTLSAVSIAEEMQLSSSYLGRIFHASYNMSISEYLNRTRVEKAHALLLSSDDTVESIIGSVGFENTKYFYVVFKNLVGCTPLQYRKQNGKS